MLRRRAEPPTAERRSATVTKLVPLADIRVRYPDGTTIPGRWFRQDACTYVAKVPPFAPAPPHGTLIQVGPALMGVEQIYQGGLAS